MQQLETKPSPFVSLSMPDYQAADGISKSKLDLIHRSPAHYRHELMNPTPATDAMMQGSMVHQFILEPEVFHSLYAVLTEKIDRRTKEGKAAWEEWQDANFGKMAVDKPTLTQLEGMRDAIFSHPHAGAALSGGIAELAMFWERDGILCKARPDYIRDGLLIDLKTTQDARIDAFSRSCWTYRYHVQSAYYCDGYETVTGEKPHSFLFIAIEKTPPYGLCVYHANEEMVSQGRREYMNDLAVYAACVESDRWPGYAEEVSSIMLPAWCRED